MNIRNKFNNAIITGASSGIGLEFAKQLGKAGLNLLLIARNKETLEDVKSQIESKDNKIHILSIDLTSEDSISRIKDFLASNDFKPDLLINNAGAGVYGNFESTDINRDLDIINLNMIALTKLCKLITGVMDRGTILNVSSTIAFRKSPKWAVYSATKAYVLSLTKSLSFENKNSSVQFSVLCPGRTESSFDINAGYSNTVNQGKSNTTDVVAYSIKKLTEGKSMIIPGVANKIKYIIFKYFPEFLTDILIKQL